MTNPTSNFGWQMPTPTDLVTDLPADFEVFGQAVDTSMADLKGGTTGQILSKATNADMDFTWITNDVGDITAVTAGTGISGGGTSGAVTITNSMATAIDAKGDLIAGTGADTFARLATGTAGQVLAVNTATATGLEWITPNPGDITAVTVTSPITGGGTSGSVGIAIQDASTTQKGAIQLVDSVANTSLTLAPTANALKTTYDTAAAAIPKSTVTTAGDVIYATGSGTVTRLGIGTAGQVLTVNGGATAPSWTTISATPTAAGAQVFRTTTQNIAAATTVAVTWSSAGTNTNSIWAAGSPTRFTVPTGKGGVWNISAALTFNNASGQVQFYVYKNGSALTSYSYVTALNASNINGGSFSSILTLAAADYLEIFVRSNNAAEIVANVSSGNMFYLGA